MSITRLESNARMSQAVTHNGLVYLAGQVSDGDTVTAQTQNVLDNVDRLLAEVGSDKSKILTATIWITDMAEFGEMNAVWDAWVDPANPPARACTEAPLALPKFKVEIMLTAAI
ncbi:MAG: enamine deaminase RidA (YjgF/YER057c/UK114 family) [Paracoccaceae bacterium]|jgi:enamine deaminase RidA (YjgF/YER057c/UK114 family)